MSMIAFVRMQASETVAILNFRYKKCNYSVGVLFFVTIIVIVFRPIGANLALA
ncbi:MAG: hypothetical protein LBP59_04295 [Planctomycetaceae bacterium]|nr:hypothetical protein [Planctomycetaceae bacterium]